MIDRFKAASPNQQLWLAVGGVCAVAALLFISWFTFLRTTYQPLFTNLKTSDASTIVAELGRKKVPYRLANGGATILVPSEMVDSARLDVMGGDMPLKGTVGFELFNKTDMGLTDFAQKINYQRALQGELERTIMTLDGVDTARVHLSMGEDRLFRDDQSPPKASITIRMARGAALSEGAAQGVKRLVAAAVPKMNLSDVVLLDERGRTVVAPVVNSSLGSPMSPFLKEKRAVEEFYEGRILQMLSEAGFSQIVSAKVSANTYLTLDDHFTEWSPTTRNFPIQVTLSSVDTLQPADEERLRTLVSKATGASLAGKDIVLFDGSLPEIALSSTERQAGEPKPRSPVLPLPVPTEDALAFDWLGLIIPVLVVLLAGFLLVRKLRGPRRLSAERQAEFVERIRAVLEERERRATSRP